MSVTNKFTNVVVSNSLIPSYVDASSVLLTDANKKIVSSQYLPKTRGGLEADISSIFPSSGGPLADDRLLIQNKTTLALGYINKSDISVNKAEGAAFFDSSQNLQSSAQLGVKYGGTNIDGTSSTGVLKYNAGSTSINTIVNADVSATAEILRSKLATELAKANYALFNNASGVMDSSSFVQLNSNDLKLSPTDDVHITSKIKLGSGKNGGLEVFNSSSSTIATVATTSDKTYNVNIQVTARNTANGEQFSTTFTAGIKNVGGTVTIVSPANQFLIVDSSFTLTDVSVTASSSSFVIALTNPPGAYSVTAVLIWAMA